jgi:hypothetical protein
MPDYFNPDSFNPGTDFKPNSALGGMMWAEDRNRYNELADMFQQSQGYDLARKGVETSEFMADAPIRSLGGQAKAAGFQADIETKVPRAQADLQSVLGQNETRDLTNRATRATQPSAIAKTIAENVASKGETEFKEYALGWQKAAGLAAEADQIDPNWRSTGSLPVSISSKLDSSDPMQRNLMRTPQPGKVLAAIVEASPEFIKAQALQGQQDKAALERTKYSSDSSAAASRYGVDARERTAKAAADARIASARTFEAKANQAFDQAKAFAAKGDKENADRSYQEYLSFREAASQAKREALMLQSGIGAGAIGTDNPLGAAMSRASQPAAPAPHPGRPLQQQQGQPQSFPDEAAALASGVKGIVIINGRRARID